MDLEKLMNKLCAGFLIALAAVACVPTTLQAQRRSITETNSRRNTDAAAGATRQNKATTPAPPATSAAQTPPPSAPSIVVSSDINKGEPCGCESPLPDVLAVVNGTKLTIKDVDTPNNLLEEQVRNLQRQVIEARARELDLQINSRLLEAEARRRGMSTAKLLEGEVMPKVKPPTDAEAQAVYDQNRSQLQAEFKDVKNQIIAYLRDQGQREETRKYAESLRAAASVKLFVDKATPPATPVDRARVLATVGGAAITSGDIEDNLRPLIYDVQEQVYEQRRAALETKINDMLLGQEAQKRKTTVQVLLDSEMKAKTNKVSETEAQAFYDQNKNRISGEFGQVKNQIVQYLQAKEEEKATARFAEQLRRGALIQTFLAAPEPPTYSIATDDQPTKGNLSAAVTIVEFTDFQCPSCAQAHPVFEKLADEYADRVKFVVRDFPLAQHEQAFKAAEAAEAAREQGKYWEYIALLFSNQKALETNKLKEYAGRLNLDQAKFDQALDTGRFADKVRRDLQDGNKLGVDATPTVFINGRPVKDRSYEAMKRVIDAALKPGAKR